MGVPGFVAWLYKNHKNTNFIFKQLFKSNTINPDLIKDNIHDLDDCYFEDNIRVDTVEHLLIDANCLIHPQAQLICSNNLNLVESNLELLEKKIIKQIINYLELIISQINPTQSIYIAVDGVAPMAKIKHQRLRRFKSIYDRKRLELIAKKHNRVLPKAWNNSAITPGTIFMDKLMKAIVSWINNNKFSCKVIFSSSYTPGEGEHKLLQYLKTLDLQLKDTSVIYGLDADLLFLSLAANRNNLFLMRETSQMETNYVSNTDDGFSYLSINIFKDIIYEEMLSRLNSEKIWDKTKIINDFVFLCYFCGNDFISNIPSLSIKPQNKKLKNGIETIIETYSRVILDLNQYLININDNQININKEVFLEILKDLADKETQYYHDMFKYKRFIQYTKLNDPFEIDKYNYEENIINKYNDPIELGDPKQSLNDWKLKYYKHYFDIDNIDGNSLNYVLDQYVKGLVWTTQYYYNKCKDYEWYYEFHHGPFISDLYNYVMKKPYRIDHFEKIYNLDGVWFENQIKPLQQLMLVLPHESSYLITATYRTLMYDYRLKKYFPDRILDINIDYLYKNKAWQNIPLIEVIPARKVLKITSNVILNDEKERNQLYKDYIKN